MDSRSTIVPLFQNYIFFIFHVAEVTEEWKNANLAASDMVKLSLNHKKRKFSESVVAETETIALKKGKLSESVIKEMEDHVNQMKEKISDIEGMLSEQSTKKQRPKLQQMQRRRALRLFEDNRIRRRAITNQGNRSLLDSEDEEFVAKCIEDKATYHGRRQDLVMYTNRRVKKADLLNIANYKLMSRNKKLIKSCTTVYNRARPKNARSIQAKQHKGKGLFCTKKPLKAEDIDNENTHYQRAHVKNIKMAFYSKKAEHSSNLCFMQSIDDRAYLRPRTSEGFMNARNQRIFTVNDVNRARQLPKYDRPQRLVYQTLGHIVSLANHLLCPKKARNSF